MRVWSAVLELVAVVLIAVVLFTIDWRLTAVWVALICGALSWFLERSGDEPSSPDDPGED